MGSAELNVLLHVLDPPRIEGPSEENFPAQLNKPAILHCQISGSEPILVEWLFQGELIGGTELDTRLEGQ